MASFVYVLSFLTEVVSVLESKAVRGRSVGLTRCGKVRDCKTGIVIDAVYFF